MRVQVKSHSCKSEFRAYGLEFSTERPTEPEFVKLGWLFYSHTDKA